MSETIERNNRFYEQPNGEMLTENEQLKEWLVVANKEIERLNNIIQGMIDNEEKYNLEINRLKEDIKRITNICNEKIKIINDVREYIENNLWSDYGDKCDVSKKEIFQILDKENK